MKEEKTIDEKLEDMKIKEDDPEVLRKRIEDLENKLQQLEHENVYSESKSNTSEDEIYNQLLDAYANNQINKDNYEFLDSQEAIKEYKGELEKELISMDNINEKIIQKISNYINKKQIFNDFSPTDSAKAGIFLTKLIEISPLTEITLKLERGSDIDCFAYGFAGKKKIIVQGDLGDCIGYHIKAGELEINGNVSGRCGYQMTGGSIEIKECVKGDSGSSMEGGKIIVHGNVNGDCGCYIMKGGLIEISGNVNGNVAADMVNGEIKVKGDVNGDCGCHIMKGGLIEIDGNVKGYVAAGIVDGRIHIKGDVNGKCGPLMKGGAIEIGGNVYSHVAQDMTGGTIRINGDKKPELHMKKRWRSGDKVLSKTGGSVYHKGKLLG